MVIQTNNSFFLKKNLQYLKKLKDSPVNTNLSKNLPQKKPLIIPEKGQKKEVNQNKKVSVNEKGVDIRKKEN